MDNVHRVLYGMRVFPRSIPRHDNRLDGITQHCAPEQHDLHYGGISYNPGGWRAHPSPSCSPALSILHWLPADALNLINREADIIPFTRVEICKPIHYPTKETIHIKVLDL